jgi:sigma-B regulation protein RsbU (phosphoserine phosphatase)
METILIVDDSEDSRRLLSAFLKREGFQLQEAADGANVLEICREQQPDMILLDVVMPIKDGYQTCKELKDNPETENIPVIFLSAKDDSSDKVKGLQLGAVDYITKPFDKAEVIARVKTQLKIHNLTRALSDSNRLLQEKQTKIEEDLKAAAQIQYALIPSSKPDLKEISFAWQFIPSDQSGGDIFNIHQLDHRTIVAYLVDVSGHGVPAAMVTVSVVQSLQPHGHTILDINGEKPFLSTARNPSEVLDILNKDYPIERFDKYFTIIYLTIDRFSGEMSYSSAGHPPPLLLRASGAIEQLNAGGPMMGLGDMLPFEEGHTRLMKGDRLFLHTDGITEYCRDKEFFGRSRLEREISNTKQLPLDSACERIINSMHEFGGDIQADDDITLVALEFNGQENIT